MRTIEISASRTIKIENLTPEYRNKIPKDHKGDEFTFSAGPKDREVPKDIQEALTVMGPDKVYDIFMKQLRTDLGNELAMEIVDLVSDPKKTGRKAGKAIQVEL